MHFFESVSRVDTVQDDEIENLKKEVDFSKRIVLVTGHRRENHGQGFINICQALKEIGESVENIQIIYPVHLNPKVQKPVYEILGDQDNNQINCSTGLPRFCVVDEQGRISDYR